VSVTLIAPTKVLFGDKIIVNKQAWFVNYVEGPDAHGAVDYYLVNETGTLHYITAEPVIVIA
jgi:hypothetical protein